MRLIPLLTLAAVTAASAGAQTPRARVFSYDTDRSWQDRDEHRAALGVGTTATGTLRDTLGVMITSITKGSPAEKAGLEEGNRLAAINGVSLRANAADIEDAEISGTLTRRLTRELAKSKPGDEVELRVYREGRTSTVKVKTADSDSLFGRRQVIRLTRSELEDRPALGIGIGNTGGKRDTLGVLIMSVGDSTPAARAGLEEGNRIAAINGVSLRVATEDAGDRYVGSAKAQRLRREISQLKPGSDVTLRVYSNGQFRDVRLKVARAGDLPKGSNRMIYIGDGGGMLAPMPPMPPMGAMPAMPAMPPVRTMDRMRIMRAPDAPSAIDAPDAPMAPMAPMGPMRIELDDEPMDFHFEFGPEIEAAINEVGVQLERIQPRIEEALREVPRALQRIQLPRVEFDVRVNESDAKPVKAPRAVRKGEVQV